MNLTKPIDPDEVKYFKKLLCIHIHRWTEGSGISYEPLAIAAAAEEVAQEIRRRVAKDFGDCPPISFEATQKFKAENPDPDNS